MSIQDAYLQIIQEEKSSHEVKTNLKTGENLAGKLKVDGQEGQECDSPEEAEAHHTTKGSDSKPKVLKKESQSNPFDRMYAQILENEDWEAEADAEEMGHGGHDLDFSGDIDGGGELEASEDEEEEEKADLSEVLTALRAAVEALEKLVGHEEEEEEEEEEENFGEDAEEGSDEEMPEEEGSDEEMPEDNLGEEVDADIIGHALVDLAKLEKGLSNPKSQVVKGAVPVAKGKAQTPKGGKADGELSELKGKGENLQSKSNDTKAVKNKTNWYDQ